MSAYISDTANKVGLRLIIAVAISAVLLGLVGAGIWSLADTVDEQTLQQGAYTLRDSIRDASVQCYSIEGQYPPSLEYLKEHYGITVNEDDYTVVYEVFASNVPPTVEVRINE